MKNVKKEAEKMFLNKPSEKEVQTVVGALKMKKEKDDTTDCNVDTVVEIIEKLGNETTETALDTMMTTAMLLPTPLLMFAMDKLKSLATVKMLKDMQDKFTKKDGEEDENDEPNPMKGFAAAMALKEMLKGLKEIGNNNDDIKSILN